jgi:hypothetical protein
MKNSIILIGLGLFAFSVVLHSCKKDKATPPILTTAEPTEITRTTVTSGGNISSDGGEEIVVAGICWSTSENPSVKDKHTNDGNEPGNYTSKLTGLTSNTKYYIRAYAYNKEGAGYGNEVSFTTSPVVNATITTAEVTLITSNSAKSGGNITADGGGTITARGVCWSTSHNPTIADNKTSDGTGTGTFTSNLTDLISNTTYFIRAYVTNSAGTSYGNELSFTTSPIGVPTVTTTSVTSITLTSAVSGGNITNDGGQAITSRGVCWNTTGTPTISDIKTSDGTATGSFTSNLTALTPGTNYFIRAYATNSIGTSYGDEKSFKTLTDVPSGQIIADHRIVADFDKIPAYYINEVKKMWFDLPGESHGTGVCYGVGYVQQDYGNTYKSVYTQSGTPEAYTTDHLRISEASWGDISTSSGWIYSYGEEDWWTTAAAIARTKAGLSYCNSNGLAPSAFGFGWCSDMDWLTIESTGTDPVFGCHWFGMSDGGPQGDRCWGLDDADNAVSGNTINLDTYLSVTQQYIDYCTANSIPTKVFFTTGPVNNLTSCTDEQEYQAWLKMERIRNYVKADPTRILFDYADILCYNDDGSTATRTWNGHTIPCITTTNLGSESIGHIGRAGCLRLGKAVWWMLARMAGWDGN